MDYTRPEIGHFPRAGSKPKKGDGHKRKMSKPKREQRKIVAAMTMTDDELNAERSRFGEWLGQQ